MGTSWQDDDHVDHERQEAAAAGFLGAAWLSEGSVRDNVRDSVMGWGFLYLAAILIAVVITLVSWNWHVTALVAGAIAWGWGRRVDREPTEPPTDGSAAP